MFYGLQFAADVDIFHGTALSSEVREREGRERERERENTVYMRKT